MVEERGTTTAMTNVRNGIGNMSSSATQGNQRQSDDVVLAIEAGEEGEHPLNWYDRRPSQNSTSTSNSTSRVSQSQRNLQQSQQQQQQPLPPPSASSTSGRLDDHHHQQQQQQQQQQTGNRFLHSNSDSVFAVSRRGGVQATGTTSIPATGMVSGNSGSSMMNTSASTSASNNSNNNNNNGGGSVGVGSSIRNRNTRSWRMNLNNILSIPPILSTETLRTLITGNLHYNLVNQSNNNSSTANASGTGTAGAGAGATAATASSSSAGATMGATVNSNGSGGHHIFFNRNNSSNLQSPTGNSAGAGGGGGGGSGGMGVAGLSGSSSCNRSTGFRLNLARLPILRQNSLPIDRANIVSSSNSTLAQGGDGNNVEMANISLPSSSSRSTMNAGKDTTATVNSSNELEERDGAGGGGGGGGAAPLPGGTSSPNAGSAAVSPVDDEQSTDGRNHPDENNPTGADDIPEFLSNFVAGFVRYIPIISIVLTKYIYDHLWGTLDVLILQTFMYSINISLRREAMKLSHKSYTILIRDLMILLCVIMYRVMVSDAPPDPIGLIIMPSSDDVMTISKTPVPSSGSTTTPATTIISTPRTTSVAAATSVPEVLPTFVPVKFNGINSPGVIASSSPSSDLDDNSDSSKSMLSATSASNLAVNTEFLRRFEFETTANRHDLLEYSIKLEVMIYYIAVNDLVLKLLTQLIKVVVTAVPAMFIRHKNRARLYVLIEYVSQFYRSLVPIHIWLTYLNYSYKGYKVIVSMFFTSIYLCAKVFEVSERCKLMTKAFINFLRNQDYDRKPTKEELDACENICAICHDVYNSPIVLQCGHIFCDDCVSIWLKREQTCPLCRTKVIDNPIYQDSSTTYFYQLF